MSIMKYRHCPVCGEKTYHRYRSRLRCRFTPADSWQCIVCEKPQRRKRPQPMDDDGAATG
jgi:predicted nucleic acid-binding Zn ribbon protein